MKKQTSKNAIKIASVYIGTVLGAGFASGQEMLKFFAFYGYKGMHGLLITGIFFGVISYVVLNINYSNKCNSYKDFTNLIIGEKVGFIFDIVVMFFMFICFCAMFAGCGALFEQRFNIPYYYGVALMSIFCFVTFVFDVKGVVAVNSILAPILLWGCILIGMYMWFFRSTPVTNSFSETLYLITNNWISSSIIYVSYNIITAIVILSSLTHIINERYTALLSSFISGVALAVIGLILGVIILIYYNDVNGLEIPLLAIVMKYSSWIQYIYIVVLISAMFTTAVANGFGLIERITELSQPCKKYRISTIIIIIISATVFAKIGFSTMVGKIYPIFGYIGTIEIIIILLYYIKTKKYFSK